MASIKRTKAIFTGVAGAGVAALLALASVWLPVHALEEQRLTAISQNCPTIRQSLGQLQKADSRTRTYLGAAYETIATKFISPLSLRLVRNNIEAEQLFAIQTNFSAEQSRFRTAYTDYMRELESLLATDCSSNPQGFYEHLELVRAQRAALKTTTVKLAELANAQYQAVETLKESL